MQAVWEDTEHEQRGLFPVYLYQNDGTQNPADFYKCSCGIDCTSGACCCYLGPSQLSCAPAGAASCGTSEHSSNTPGRDSVVSSQVPTELLTLAIAASSIEGSREGDAAVCETAQKTCKRCGKSLPRSAFCMNTKAIDGLYTQCRACVSQKDQERRTRLKTQKRRPASSKICSRCHLDKKSEDYYLDAGRPDGLQTYCKHCFSLTYKDKRRQRGLGMVA